MTDNLLSRLVFSSVYTMVFEMTSYWSFDQCELRGRSLLLFFGGEVRQVHGLIILARNNKISFFASSPPFGDMGM